MCVSVCVRACGCLCVCGYSCRCVCVCLAMCARVCVRVPVGVHVRRSDCEPLADRAGVVERACCRGFGRARSPGHGAAKAHADPPC